MAQGMSSNDILASIRRFAGWPASPTPAAPEAPAMAGAPPAFEVDVKSEREERPRFRRKYTVDLPRGLKMTVTIKTLHHLGRYPSGELTQPGGRWVLFDPERIAEKILDPELVPLIEERVAAILTIDKAYMAQAPAEFVDEAGVTWLRAARG